MSFKHIFVVNVFYTPYSYGGATIVAEEVSVELAKNHDFMITAISTICRDDIAPYTVLKVERYGISNYLINLPKVRNYSEVYNNPQVDEIVARLIDALSPDLMHLHCIQDIGAGIISAAKRRNLPVVLSIHDFWWICERQFMIKPSGVYCAQNPVKFENCKGCVTNITNARTRYDYLLEQAAMVDILTYPSNFAKDLCAKSGLNARENIVWQNGVTKPNADFFKQQEKRRQIDPRISFGYVGGPSHIKGWPIIRTAFTHLKQDNFAGYLVDGSLDGTWWSGVDISTMKGDWKIHPRYNQATMDAFYSKIDVLLFMSQWKETYGLTIREAISRGIHVIQTDSGGTIEHEAAIMQEMFEIGDKATKLTPQLEKILGSSHKHPKSTSVRSYSDQAKEFSKIIEPLIL